MADSRSTALLTRLLLGFMALLLLTVVVIFLVPVVPCPACIGWTLAKGSLTAPSYVHGSQHCRFCKGTGKATLFKNWLITKKEGRPCYYMDHDD